MKQLARTLLILGGVAACERAQPVVDPLERPAVGNIGQTGRPAAITVPLADASGVPAIGNIGQTGAPEPRRERRRERVQRAQRVDRESPPVANVMVKSCGVKCETPAQLRARFAIIGENIARPLLDARERPAVGNVVRRGKGQMMTRGEAVLADLDSQLDHMRALLADTSYTDEQRVAIQHSIDDMSALRGRLAHEVAHQ